MKGLGNEIFIYRNEKSNERKFLGMKSLGIESSFLGTKGLGHEKSASPRQYLTTLFLQAGCPFCHPTNSVKALKTDLTLEVMNANYLIASFTMIQENILSLRI